MMQVWGNGLLNTTKPCLMRVFLGALAPKLDYKGGGRAIVAMLPWEHLYDPCFLLTTTVTCRTLHRNNPTVSCFWCQEMILKLCNSLFSIQRLCLNCLSAFDPLNLSLLFLFFFFYQFLLLFYYVLQRPKIATLLRMSREAEKQQEKLLAVSA